METAVKWLVAIVVAATMFAGGEAAATPGRSRAFLGSWEYDASGSSFVGRNPYQRATMRFTGAGKGFHTVWDVVVANGTNFHFEYDDPGDGSIVPVAGNPYYDSQSTVWPDDRTLIRTERRGGKVIGYTTMALAEDGKSYTSTAHRIVPEGKLYTAIVVWKRSGS